MAFAAPATKANSIKLRGAIDPEEAHAFAATHYPNVVVDADGADLRAATFGIM